MTVVILTDGIDLSVGAMMALSGTTAAGLMVGGMNGTLVLIICLTMGTAFGFTNEIFVSTGRMPPIIVTAATTGITLGLALMYSGGCSISGWPLWLCFFANETLGGVPVPIVALAVTHVAG